MILVCFSHLRWDFVYQRPQHLISRFRKDFSVYYVEELIYSDEEDGFKLNTSKEGVNVVVPHLKHNSDVSATENERLKAVIKKLFEVKNINNYIFWYYTPMVLPFTHDFNPHLVIYDCMDELSAFKFAPPAIKEYEKHLLASADLVFTGGVSLYEAKRYLHPDVHLFPSSIDKEHFNAARQALTDPEDQKHIPHPRLGFFGVIDERFDIELIKQSAISKPDWQFILLGPVVKIAPETLPKNTNIHYLGSKKYDELPQYLRGWDIALIPFALNESTRFISPTKTPEYLAAGKPVISTAIPDVVESYGKAGLVHIVQNSSEFVEKASVELNSEENKEWLQKVDDYLTDLSWDKTWNKINLLITNAIKIKQNSKSLNNKQYV